MELDLSTSMFMVSFQCAVTDGGDVGEQLSDDAYHCVVSIVIFTYFLSIVTLMLTMKYMTAY